MSEMELLMYDALCCFMSVEFSCIHGSVDFV